MKKILTLAACAALCTSTLLADIKIGDTTYNTLSDAITAATNETDVITISGEIPAITSTITITNKSITITGAENAVITATNTSSAVIVIDTGGSLNMSNVTFDGNNQTWANRNIIEMKAGNNALNNVTFKNAATTHAGGLMRSISNSKVTLENVTVENCTVNEGRGEFFCGQNNSITVKGYNNFKSIYIEKQLYIKAENPTNTTPITIYLDNRTSGNVVTGCTDLSKFNFVGCAEGYEVGVVGENLAVQKVTYVADVNSSGVKSWEALLDALTETENIVSLNEGITIPSRWLINTANFNATFKSATDEPVNITRGTFTDNNVLIELTNTATNPMLRFENINFVNENEKVTGPMLNIARGNMYLINCTENFITTAQKVNIKDGGSAHLENCQFSSVNVNANGKLYLSGDNKITANICAVSGTKYPQIIIEAAEPKAVITPIELTFDNAESIAGLDKPFITGTTDINMFSLPDDLGYKLEPNADKTGLILKTKVQSGVENVMAEDADAPVEWFNLHGIRVANPENGIYIRRQGSKVEKVVL